MEAFEENVICVKTKVKGIFKARKSLQRGKHSLGRRAGRVGTGLEELAALGLRRG